MNCGKRKNTEKKRFLSKNKNLQCRYIYPKENRVKSHCKKLNGFKSEEKKI
jgi:hypothetical protein